MAADPHAAPIHIQDVPEQSWDVGELKAKRRRLGAATGARRLGVAIIEVAPGARATPPHSHADEDELFLVLEGSGLSWQSSGSKDARTYEIKEGDVLFHESNGDAHTLIAGANGLKVLVLAEGSRTNITYLPRTKQFWLGPRWSPADSAPPFVADAECGPLEVPPPTAARPATIVALTDCPPTREDNGRFRTTYWEPSKETGCERLVLAIDELEPGGRSCVRHWHTVREECFLVLRGTGSVQIGDANHEVGPGSFFFRPADTGVPHAIDAGADGLRYVTMGDLTPGDLCFYPDSNKVSLGRGLIVRAELLDYFEDEPDAAHLRRDS